MTKSTSTARPTRGTVRTAFFLSAVIAATFGGTMLMSRSALGATREFTLTAAAAIWEIAPGQQVTAWTYNATVPGPELRVSAGDTIRVTVVATGLGQPVVKQQQPPQMRVVQPPPVVAPARGPYRSWSRPPGIMNRANVNPQIA